MIFKEGQKRYPIEKSEVWEAFKHVRAKGESPGIDGISGKRAKEIPLPGMEQAFQRKLSPPGSTTKTDTKD